MINNDKISDRVVGLDAVNMVHGFAWKQFASDDSSGNYSMVFPFFASDGNNSISFSVETSGSPISGVALPALAECFGVCCDIVRMPKNTFPTIRTGAFDKFSSHDVEGNLVDKYITNGIRYLDAGSRGSGAGTHNYVVFDDALIEILKRNGVPVEGLLE